MKKYKKVEYDIDMKVVLSNIFSYFKNEELEEFLEDFNTIHVIYTLRGYSYEEYGKPYTVAKSYVIYDIDKKEIFWLSDERIDYNLNRILGLCGEHFISHAERNKKILKELEQKGITWKETLSDEPIKA